MVLHQQFDQSDRPHKGLNSGVRCNIKQVILCFIFTVDKTPNTIMTISLPSNLIQAHKNFEILRKNSYFCEI